MVDSEVCVGALAVPLSATNVYNRRSRLGQRRRRSQGQIRYYPPGATGLDVAIKRLSPISPPPVASSKPALQVG